MSALPTLPPTEPSITIINATSAEVQWMSPHLSGRGGNNITYTIDVVPFPNQKFADEAVLQSQLYNASEVDGPLALQNLTLSSLEAAVSYYVRCCISNSVGQGPCSDNITFTMPDSVPTAAPQNVTCVNSTYPIFTITGGLVPAVYQHGKIINYSMQYAAEYAINKILADCSNAEFFYSNTTAKTNISISFPTTGVNLMVKVAAATSAGLGPFSSCIRVPLPQVKSSNIMTIATGAGAGGAALLILSILLVLFILRRRRLRKKISVLVGKPSDAIVDTGISESKLSAKNLGQYCAYPIVKICIYVASILIAPAQPQLATIYRDC